MSASRSGLPRQGLHLSNGSVTACLPNAYPLSTAKKVSSTMTIILFRGDFGKGNNEAPLHIFFHPPQTSSSRVPAPSYELGSDCLYSKQLCYDTAKPFCVPCWSPKQSRYGLMHLLPRMLSSEAWMPSRRSGSPTLSASFLSRLRACLATSCRLTSALTVARANCLWACMLHRPGSPD